MEDSSLIILVITFELIQLIWPQYLSITDGQMTYNSNTALCTECIAP